LHARQLVADVQNPAIPVLQNKQFFDYLLHWAISVASLQETVTALARQVNADTARALVEHFMKKELEHPVLGTPL
jgi:hypothetical protein